MPTTTRGATCFACSCFEVNSWTAGLTRLRHVTRGRVDAARHQPNIQHEARSWAQSAAGVAAFGLGADLTLRRLLASRHRDDIPLFGLAGRAIQAKEARQEGPPSTARPPKSSEKAEKKKKAVEEEEPPPPPPPPPPAIGLRWQKLAPSKPTTGRELSSESLVEALLQKQYLKEPLQFTAEQYHSFELGAEPLTASDFIKAGQCYFGPERVFTSVQSKIGAWSTGRHYCKDCARGEAEKEGRGGGGGGVGVAWRVEQMADRH